MEENLNGRQPQWKVTSMKDDLNRRQTQWKMTSMEDKLNGRQSQLKMTSWNPYRKQMTPACLASKSCTELGPAQPQLVLVYYVTLSFLETLLIKIKNTTYNYNKCKGQIVGNILLSYTNTLTIESHVYSTFLMYFYIFQTRQENTERK